MQYGNDDLLYSFYLAITAIIVPFGLLILVNNFVSRLVLVQKRTGFDKLSDQQINVIVEKSDGGVCLCSDCKVTIIKFVVTIRYL